MKIVKEISSGSFKLIRVSFDDSLSFLHLDIKLSTYTLEEEK